MSIKVGDVIEVDGAKRIVTGFTVAAGDTYPNTELYTEPEEVEIVKEIETAGEPTLKCQYCGKVCKNALGLGSHEEHCKENPKNKGE